MSLLKTVRGSEGLTLFVVLFVMAFFLLFVTGGLFFARLNLKAAGNFKLATQAIEVADAGLHHALAVIPWVWDFDTQLNCATPPCLVREANGVTYISNKPFGSGFTYTVKARNDQPADPLANDDTNNQIVLTAEANGPSNTKKVVEAYVRRSVAVFTPPAALYINAASSAPALGSHYFDDDDSIKIIGNDTNPVALSNGSDDTAGPKASLLAVATTSSTVTTALKNEYTNSYNGVSMHDVFHGDTYLGVNLGPKVEPSIGTVGDVLDISEIASKFISQTPNANKFTDLAVNPTSCPGGMSSPPNPVSCSVSGGISTVTLGTALSPQLVYLRDSGSPSKLIQLLGNVTGYGVLVVEGRAVIGANFRYDGLVVYKRPSASSYVSFEDNAWVYGGVLLGSFDEGDGQGKKVRFRVEDFSRIFYSSEALAMVNTNWGSLLPKPPRVFAWLDK